MANDFDAIVIGSGLGGLTARPAHAHLLKIAQRPVAVAEFAEIAAQRRGRARQRLAQRRLRGVQAVGTRSPGRQGAAQRLVEFPGRQAAPATRSAYQPREGTMRAKDRVAIGFVQRGLHGQRAVPVDRGRATKLPSRLQHQDPLAVSRWQRRRGALAGLLFSGQIFELIGEARHTVLERFDRHFGGDEAAKCALGGPLGYFDDDPAKLSYLLYGHVWASFAETGSYYFKGGPA